MKKIWRNKYGLRKFRNHEGFRAIYQNHNLDYNNKMSGRRNAPRDKKGRFVKNEKWMKHVLYYGFTAQQLDANDAGFIQRVTQESVAINNWQTLVTNRYVKFQLDMVGAGRLLETLYGRNCKIKAVRVQMTSNSREYIVGRFVNPDGAEAYSLSVGKAKIYVKAESDGGLRVPVPTFYFYGDTNRTPELECDIRVFLYFSEIMMTGARQRYGEQVLATRDVV